MKADTSRACRCIVRGRVQGVGFRYSASSQGASLGITGYVRNRSDGSVEVWAEGPSEALESMTSWLKKGPPAASVARVDCKEHPPTGKYRTFSIRF